MNEWPEVRTWQLLGDATWRSGYAFGASYPSLILSFQGEKLSKAEQESLSSHLIESLAIPKLAEIWLARAPVIGATGFTEITRLLLLALSRLQREAGLAVFEDGRALEIDGSKARVIIPTSEGSYKLVLEILNWLVNACGLIRAGQGIGDHSQLLSSLLQQLQSHFGNHSVFNSFIAVAQRAGVPFVELPERVIQYGHGHLARRMQLSITDKTSLIGVHLARLKHCGAQVLRDAGIPVPAHQLVSDVATALQVADQLGYPVVVKPADLDAGIAVSADLRTPAEVRQAFDAVKVYTDRVLVEKHVEGRDYRLTVFNDTVIWAVERIPGGVTGDGRASIGELIDRINSDPRRQVAGHAPLKPLTFDDEASSLLDRAGLSLQSVPPQGEFIRLRRTANVGRGGTPVAVFDKVHPDNALLASRAAAALGLDLAGVDILIPDIARSWFETGAAICEVNAGPEIGQTTAIHLYEPIFTSLVQGTGRIPIILIVGPAPDSPLDRLVAKGLSEPDAIIGYHDRHGVRVETERLTAGPVLGFFGGRILVRDRRVEAVIMQVNDDSLRDTSLPFARFDLIILAGNALAATNGKPARPGAEIAIDLITSLLPACDGSVAIVEGADVPLDGLEALTTAKWLGTLSFADIETLLREEIRRLAKVHRVTENDRNDFTKTR
jgi:cyanophycin synthetase